MKNNTGAIVESFIVIIIYIYCITCILIAWFDDFKMVLLQQHFIYLLYVPVFTHAKVHREVRGLQKLVPSTAWGSGIKPRSVGLAESVFPH